MGNLIVNCEFRLDGGKGSGNFGHSGRPGQVGGSGSGESIGKSNYYRQLLKQGDKKQQPPPFRNRILSDSPTSMKNPVTFFDKEDNWDVFNEKVMNACEKSGQDGVEMACMFGANPYSLGIEDDDDKYTKKWPLVYKNGYDRNELDKEYGISGLIENNPELQIDYSGPLYRGVTLSEQEFDNIIKSFGNGTIDMKGVSSWSMNEQVGHMYATADQKMTDGKTHKVVFVSEGIHHNAMAYPYTVPADEIIQSKSAKYEVTAISHYEPNEDNWYDDPVEYIWLREK